MSVGSGKLVRMETELEARQETLRKIADTAEGAAGAFIGGYVNGRFGDVGGVAIDGVTALILTVAGVALDQRDVAAFGTGMGFAHLGIKAAQMGHAAKVAEAKKTTEAAGKKEPEAEREPERREERSAHDDDLKAAQKEWRNVMEGKFGRG